MTQQHTVVILECAVNVVADALPDAHAARIVHLDGLLLVVVAPVLFALEEERPIVVAPHQGRIDARQMRRQAEARQRLRIAQLQGVGIEAEVLFACLAQHKQMDDMMFNSSYY